MNTINTPKRGRKPVPKNKIKKNVTICMPTFLINKLKKDAKEGKAETFNKMVTKIVDRYYKKKEEKEKNKSKEENITNKKAA